MVFGDGDGTVFVGFTSSLSVIGHELTHGATQYSANLTYEGQSGALNEWISNVFGALVEQCARQQSVVEGTALRSMRAPGTAYDDDVLGKDPQPADMAGYLETEDDNGGVHLNSGIANRAFYLAATAIGGTAWEGAGRIWYDTLTGGSVPADCDFAEFVRLTTHAAAAHYGLDSVERSAVTMAWRTAEVTP
jgi:Zn-dependent metalloprotease